MSTHARLAVAALLAAVLVPSCIASDSSDVGTADEDIHGPGSLANLVPGPCADACLAVAADACGSWLDECADDYPRDESVTCGGKTLTCEAAKYAAEATPFGVTWCYRDCEHLHK